MFHIFRVSISVGVDSEAQTLNPCEGSFNREVWWKRFRCRVGTLQSTTMKAALFTIYRLRKTSCDNKSGTITRYGVIVQSDVLRKLGKLDEGYHCFLSPVKLVA
jgi:hypothetical protein